MGIPSRPVHDIPDDTFLAARKIFHIEHIYLLVGDRLCEILDARNVSLLDSTASLGSSLITRLALVSAFQYAEYLPDALAADATLRRMDWKYALHLPLQHPGIAADELCRFRQNLFCSPKALTEFQRLLEDLGQLGLYARLTLKHLDPVNALLSVCKINRFYLLNQAMKAALSVLVAHDPEWLRANAMPHWYARYQTGRLITHYDPSIDDGQEEACSVGADMKQLLQMLRLPDCQVSPAQAEMAALARIFEDQFINEDGLLHWRLPRCASCTSGNSG